MASCFFIGHRETSERIFPNIIETAERLICEENVTTFYVGGYGRFDCLAGEAIIQLKKKFPGIRLSLVIPYHPAIRPITAPFGYDGTFYPDGMEKVSPKYAIAKANRKMIDTSDFLIAFVTHSIPRLPEQGQGVGGVVRFVRPVAEQQAGNVLPDAAAGGRGFRPCHLNGLFAF